MCESSKNFSFYFVVEFFTGSFMYTGCQFSTNAKYRLSLGQIIEHISVHTGELRKTM